MFGTVSLVKSCRKLVSDELCLSAGLLPEDIRTPVLICDQNWLNKPGMRGV